MSAGIRPKLMAKSGFLQQPARGLGMVIRHQKSPRQNADGAFEHAHVLIEENVRDMRGFKQSLNG